LFSMCAAARGAAPSCVPDQDFLTNLRVFAQQAHDRGDVRQFDDSVDAAEHAKDSCTRYEAYEWLGEFWATSAQRGEWRHAIDAFIAAYKLAPDDHARSRPLYHYARLLQVDDDPAHAIGPIRSARDLDPGSNEIAALYAQIEGDYNNPTKQQIKRGLWDSMYKELPDRSIPRDVPAAAAPVNARIASPDASVSIPINFETGTAIVDGQTRSNVEKLAAVLADADHPAQHFMFVGHADVRGSEANNLILSKRRAEALRESVILMQPTLQSRIEVRGRGSAEPIDPGHNERAYRLNRRLQVLRELLPASN